MSQYQSDRLDRIKATLDRVLLFLKQQIKEFIELRTSIEALSNSAKSLAIAVHKQ